MLAILRRFCEARGHEFWADDVTILELLEPDAIVTHQGLSIVTTSEAKGLQFEPEMLRSPLRACDLFVRHALQGPKFTLTLTLSLVREGEGIRFVHKLSA